MRLTQRLNQLTVSEGEVLSPSKQYQALVTTVANYLAKVLNVRRGSVLIDPEFGMYSLAELGDISEPKQQAQIEQTISNVLYTIVGKDVDLSVRSYPSDKHQTLLHWVFTITPSAINREIELRVVLQIDGTYRVESND